MVTCAPTDRLVAVAATMRERNISSTVVCERGTPTGILTDRDLRNKVVARGVDCHTMTAGMIMNAPLISVGEDDYLFEALHRMSRHGIHRVGVVDGTGRLTGIITDSDILRLQTRSPQQMVREIEEARSVADLGKLHVRVQDLVIHLAGTGVPTRDLVRMIAHLNDQILVRLMTLLRRERYPDLTDRFAFIVLGSEGRQEQTLTTDQDNAIVYADDLAGADIKRLEAFSHDLIDNLIAIGVPPCPGGIMARTTPGDGVLGHGGGCWTSGSRPRPRKTSSTAACSWTCATSAAIPPWSRPLKRTLPGNWREIPPIWPTWEPTWCGSVPPSACSAGSRWSAAVTTRGSWT